MNLKPELSVAKEWFMTQGRHPFPFQEEAWSLYLQGASGIINAPTGSGKTLSLMVPIMLEALAKQSSGLQAIWITPIRALAKEIEKSARETAVALKVPFTVARRTGDTSTSDRKALWEEPPNLLITTPESLHILLATAGYSSYFSSLKVLVADEWHELIGSKRGVLMELALSRFKTISPGIKIWGISATVGNMEQASEVLFGSWHKQKEIKFITSDVEKKLEIETIIPDDIETYPWTGHLGTRLAPRVLPILERSRSTLIFTNTRGQCEVWYQKLLDLNPELSGIIAMHHGSMGRELRDWVEEALHEERIKAVVCTSSLDLGVDFRPVETIIQIGSPKGVSRFVQRAGRSGHSPGATSKIYFLPTHALEIVEGAALKEAIRRNIMEDRIPYIRSFDVLMQYIVTLAISEGFDERKIFEEVISTYSYSSLDRVEWERVVAFAANGGTLDAYDEYKRLGRDKDGIYRATEKRVATRHRLSIGTIVGANSMVVKYLSGKNLGNIEESFISKLNRGDHFWFAGKNLELVRIKENVALVRKTKAKDGPTPSWQGGRMPLSSQLSAMIRFKFDSYLLDEAADVEVAALKPLLEEQQRKSTIPSATEFLIESFTDRDGHHVLMYPFEGRFVHEGMGALLSYRIAQLRRLTFSIAMNDYGFELLSDQPIPIKEALSNDLFSTKKLHQDILSSVNAVEMARKRFRDIGAIAGLVFKGYPGKHKKERHLQSSTGLLFDVFRDYDPDNLLYLQAYDEAMTFQLEEARLRSALDRISTQHIRLIETEGPSPFSFPIIVDRMRERMTNEKIQQRIDRMKVQMAKPDQSRTVDK